MIRHIACALVFVCAFLLLCAEVQRADDANQARAERLSTSEPIGSPT